MSGQYDASLAAGAAQNFSVLGSVVKVLSAPGGAVQVKLDGGEAYTLLEGQGVRKLGGRVFRDVAVKNVQSALQAVSLFIGADEIIDTRIAGIVSVTNKIGANVTQAELSGGVLLPAGFTATQVVAPAANTKGLLIRKAAVSSTGGAGGTSEIRLIAAPTAPVITVPTNAYQLAAAAGAAGIAVSDSHVDQNYQIPAGWGVWCVTNHTVNPATAAVYSLIYEPL